MRCELPLVSLSIWTGNADLPKLTDWPEPGTGPSSEASMARSIARRASTPRPGRNRALGVHGLRERSSTPLSCQAERHLPDRLCAARLETGCKLWRLQETGSIARRSFCRAAPSRNCACAFFRRSQPRCSCTNRRPGLCLLGVIFPSGHDATPSSSRTPAIYDTSNRVYAGPFGRSAPIGHVETDRSTARWRRPTYQGPEGFRGRSAESTAQRTSTHPVRSSPDRKVVPYLRQEVSRCHSSLVFLRLDPTHWPNIG
jgi:hypothetical protein